jgi:hypothetical protein
MSEQLSGKFEFRPIKKIDVGSIVVFELKMQEYSERFVLQVRDIVDSKVFIDMLDPESGRKVRMESAYGLRELKKIVLVPDEGDEMDLIPEQYTRLYNQVGCGYLPYTVNGDFAEVTLATPVIVEEEESLLDLQYNLRKLLFVRPYDIQAIESAAIKLCDEIVRMEEL